MNNIKSPSDELIQEGDNMVKLKYGQGSIRLKRRQKKDGSVYKIYEARFIDENGSNRSFYAKTQKDCLDKLKKIQALKNRQARIQHKLTLKAWMQEWFNIYKKPSLRQSTLKSYLTFLEKIIFPKIGSLTLTEVSSEKLQAFLVGIKASNTRKKVYLLLSQAFKKAYLLKKVRDNVCETLEIPKHKKQKRRAFEFDEQNKILSAGQEFSRVFFFLCATGLRIGEFLALTKNDVFFEKHVIRVNKSIVNGNLGEPKTESSKRVIYFTDELFNEFDVNTLGTYNYERLKTALQRFLRKENITGVSWHSTRHTFATICHSFGMIDKQLQILLGHSTLAMTQDVYTHLLRPGDSKIKGYLSNLCAQIRAQI